ncbi:MAG TPA: sulfurtransferase-like selenium metabolism protein YedF [Bacillota bacterium]|jgi:selenium metabolism protein YedF|nr:sulfurtransferase-like selenium metabolism protein YedF [Bacillota bacterium]HOA35493.1 sulfurtransferase-like selenium metabolism protein YedF [Bacillota bacterium]HOJ84288.1 sulfurtransferase-like selenium metabolism protein YedF [Bacillota bacterium]HOL15490.1 sulfurtransferase-like selenium metabolism protein YedF [Bacillota bacterium]HPZ12471.1 sulfurtransferase-like selenium metabolism protein YedF [Bacillota bacterium]
MKIIDNRGLNCPEPVLRTKKAFSENPEGVISIVDNEAARENVIRMAKREGFFVRWEEKEEAYHIYITRGTEVPVEKTASTPSATCCNASGGCTSNDQVILIAAEQFGQGSEELGRLLMRNYLYTLTSRSDFPKTIIFINGGVKLCTKGSPVIEELRELQNKEVEILACGTCLDYYNLKEELSAGTISNMYEIADRLMAASRVLSL